MEFQPFFVSCVTCGSRLRVGRPELVDSIVVCPKCQSMVQLTRPTGDPPVELGNRSVDSGALTKESMSGSLDQAVSPPVQPEVSFQDETSTEAPPVFTDPPVQPARSDEAQVDLPPTPIPPNWQNQKSAHSRKIAQLIALILASIISAVILFSVFWSRRTNPPPTDVADNSANQTEVETNEDLPLPDSADNNDATSEEEDSSESSDQNSPEENTDSNEASTTPINDATANTDQDATPPEANSPIANMPENSEDPPTDLFPQNPLLPDNPLLPQNPLDGILPPTTSETEDPVTEDGPGMTALPKELASILDGLQGFERPQFENTEAPPETIDANEIDRAAADDVDIEVAIEDVEPINMRKAMAIPLAFRTANPEGYPLNDLMLVLGELSGVPIEIAWLSFDLIGQDVQDRVPLPRKWSTIEGVLKDVCTNTSAVFDQNEHSILLRPTDDRFNQAISEILDLSDLPTDSESAVTTARFLLGQTDGDPGKISVPDSVGQSQLATLVCDAIRRVRQATGKLDEASFSRWGGEYQSQISAWPKLTGGVSGDVRVQPASFVALARQIAKANGATCYINWQDAMARGLQPNTEMLPLMGDDVSAEDAMNRMIGPYQLDVRIVDNTHWWIGSAASYDRFPVVIWFADTQNSQSIQRQVQAIIAGASSDESIIGAVTVDPVSNHCIAVLPRFLIRQLPRLLKEKAEGP